MPLIFTSPESPALSLSTTATQPLPPTHHHQPLPPEEHPPQKKLIFQQKITAFYKFECISINTNPMPLIFTSPESPSPNAHFTATQPLPPTHQQQPLPPKEHPPKNNDL
jgi:hypothetical protein